MFEKEFLTERQFCPKKVCSKIEKISVKKMFEKNFVEKVMFEENDVSNITDFLMKTFLWISA